MFTPVKSGLFIIALMVVQSCSTSSPPVRFFALESMPVEYTPDPEDAIVLGIGPMRLADYLKRPQLITRDQSAELVLDEFNRWAEPLEPAIHRTLAENVDALLDTVAVVGFPNSANLDYRLLGRISRFDVDRDGLAVLEVQWRIADTEGGDITPPRRERYEYHVSRRGDPTATAEALTDALGQFSRDIARTVQELVAVN